MIAAGQQMTAAELDTRYARSHWVYFIQSETGQIKIGITKGRPQRRLGLMQSGSPVKLTLRAAVHGCPRLEADIHATYQHARLHGEWFRPDPDLLDFIEALRRDGWAA